MDRLIWHVVDRGFGWDVAFDRRIMGMGFAVSSVRGFIGGADL